MLINTTRTVLLTLFFCFAQLTATFTTQARAAEIDSFTPRAIPLEDATAAINAIINARIAEGVEKANLLDRANHFDQLPDAMCNKEVLYNELRKAIFQSFTASWGLKGYALDLQMREQLKNWSYHLSLNDSIYRDLDYLEAFSLRLKELSDVVNIEGNLVGIDKLGHFFAEGWEYFELSQESAGSFQDAMAWGALQEQGKFGYVTTGIFSFADLTANFHGWRFWNSVLRDNKDPLKGFFGNWTSKPYVRCTLRVSESLKHAKRIYAWRFNNNFDIAEYVDGAWDEGQNCNSYADPIIESKITSRMRAVNPALQCPAQKAVCHKITKRYGKLGLQLLHPQCLTAK